MQQPEPPPKPTIDPTSHEPTHPEPTRPDPTHGETQALPLFETAVEINARFDDFTILVQATPEPAIGATPQPTIDPAPPLITHFFFYFIYIFSLFFILFHWISICF